VGVGAGVGVGAAVGVVGPAVGVVPAETAARISPGSLRHLAATTTAATTVDANNTAVTTMIDLALMRVVPRVILITRVQPRQRVKSRSRHLDKEYHHDVRDER
jgi:hypothetical protein